MSPEDQEELGLLRDAFTVLEQSLAREENPSGQTILRIYIEEIERRIAETEKKPN